MGSRYNYTVIKKGKFVGGKRVLKPTMYPDIPIKDSDIFIYPKFGDRLDTLAHRYYNDVTKWWIIAKANTLKKGIIGLDPEKQIRIPTDIEPILAKLKEISYSY